ncbi:hypothetical protein DOY81_006845 [Sarcophaga bullata]|nr:hypothetical protein DOY81_006845 [Sarcophaga bullata]
MIFMYIIKIHMIKVNFKNHQELSQTLKDLIANVKIIKSTTPIAEKSNSAVVACS